MYANFNTTQHKGKHYMTEYNIKDEINDLHAEAERLPFVKKVLTGRVTQPEYAEYLYQLMSIYSPLEVSSRLQGLFDTLPGIERLQSVYEDYLELRNPDNLERLLPETMAYHNYLMMLANDPYRRHLIMAHNYVRYLGDLNGGQLFAKLVPGSGRMYQFEDTASLITNFRKLMEVDREFIDEARVAFNYMIQIVRALGDRCEACVNET